MIGRGNVKPGSPGMVITRLQTQGRGVKMIGMAAILCAWCNWKIRDDKVPGPVSHGICINCLPAAFSTPVESIASLTQEQLDQLPHGLVRLSSDGIIQEYNRTESELSGLKPADVLGKNFFEVAPCTAVRDFRGQFQELVAAGHGERRLKWMFTFSGGQAYVKIAMTKDAQDPFVSLFVSKTE